MDPTILIGLVVTEAESKVREAGLQPETLDTSTIISLQCIPRNVVRLWKENGVVVEAETQEWLDSKYTGT